MQSCHSLPGQIQTKELEYKLEAVTCRFNKNKHKTGSFEHQLTSDSSCASTETAAC